MVSLSEVVKWMGEIAENLGVDILLVTLQRAYYLIVKIMLLELRLDPLNPEKW